MSNSDWLVLGAKVCRTTLQHVCACWKAAQVLKRRASRHATAMFARVRLHCYKALSPFHLSSSPRLRSPLSLPARAVADVADEQTFSSISSLSLGGPGRKLRCAKKKTKQKEFLHLSPSF